MACEHVEGVQKPPELVAYVANEPLLFPSGSAFNYSNTDNIVVGLMAEAATGRSYERLLRSRAFSPLGLPGTSLPGGAWLPRPFAHGYILDPPQPAEDVSEAVSMSALWASGGPQSTSAELGRFIRGYVSGRLFGRALQRAQRRWVEGHSEPIGPGTNSAGLALFRYRMSCGTVYGHTGNFVGYTRFAAASSDGRRSATVSANTRVVPGPVQQARLPRAAPGVRASRVCRAGLGRLAHPRPISGLRSG